MKPEQLKHKISIQKKDPNSKDGYGHKTESWINVFTNICAYVEPTGGSEFYAAQKVNSEADHNVWIRYRAGVEPSMRVAFGSRTFDILVPINLNEGKKWLRLVCKELI